MSESRLDTGARDQFLGLFPERNRSLVSNLFLGVVRAGKNDPPTIVYDVRIGLAARASSPYPETAQKFEFLLNVVLNNLQEAEDFARYCVAYEALPYATRKAQQHLSRQKYVEQWLENNPATSAQVQYIRNLGFDGPVRNKKEASELISRLKAEQGGQR